MIDDEPSCVSATSYGWDRGDLTVVVERLAPAGRRSLPCTAGASRTCL
jgi:hypothetical protein